MTAALDGSDLRILGEPAAAGEGCNDGIAYDPVSRRLFWTNMGLPPRRSTTASSSRWPWMAPTKAGGAARLGLSFAQAAEDRCPRPAALLVRPRGHAGDALKPRRLEHRGAGADRLRRRRAQGRLALVRHRLDIDRPRRAATSVYWTQKKPRRSTAPGREGDDQARAGLNRAAAARPDARPTARTWKFVLRPAGTDLDSTSWPHRLAVYWTDRGATVSIRLLAPLDPRAFDPAARSDRPRGLHEAIGVALDPKARRMFYAALGGEVGTWTAGARAKVPAGTRVP